MTWKVAEVIANLSSYVKLAPGDLIFTGTPAGVSKVVRGDVLEGGIDGVGEPGASGWSEVRTRYPDIPVYETLDGSEIRELMHPAVHGNVNQSLPRRAFLRYECYCK